MNHLTGSFFHIMSDTNTEQIHFQGMIKECLEDNYYLVQFFNFLDGEEAYLKIFHISHMVFWRLYEFHVDWISAFNKQKKGEKNEA